MAIQKRGGKPDNRLRKAWAAQLPDHCQAVAWSPTGTYVAAAAVSGTVAVFDAKAGTVATEFRAHGFGTAAVAWSPTGQFLATAGQDGNARIWEAPGKEIAVLDGGAAWVERVAWSPDGSILATAAGRIVRLWDPTGKQLREYPKHGGTVADLAWKPGAADLLAVAAYGGVTLYDPTRDEADELYEWKGSPLVLAWSPNGKMLAHGNQDATVHFWYADGGDLQMSGYATKVRELAWDPTSRFLATGGGHVVCIWDCSGKGPEGTEPQMLEGHDRPLTALAWQRRGFVVASGGADGRVNLWQPGAKKAPHVGADHHPDGAATVVAWSPDDAMLVAGFASGDVTLYRVG